MDLGQTQWPCKLLGLDVSMGKLPGLLLVVPLKDTNSSARRFPIIHHNPERSTPQFISDVGAYAGMLVLEPATELAGIV
jgi:hypothetical protein